jgi:hypothetical protein
MEACQVKAQQKAKKILNALYESFSCPIPLPESCVLQESIQKIRQKLNKKWSR